MNGIEYVLKKKCKVKESQEPVNSIVSNVLPIIYWENKTCITKMWQIPIFSCTKRSTLYKRMQMESKFGCQAAHLLPIASKMDVAWV